LDSDKIYIPYSTMVRDAPLTDANFHTRNRERLIYVPGVARRVEGRAGTGAARAGAQTTVSRRTIRAPPSIWDTVENAQLVDTIFTSMTIFLGAIAVVTLTLGGVG